MLGAAGLMAAVVVPGAARAVIPLTGVPQVSAVGVEHPAGVAADATRNLVYVSRTTDSIAVLDGSVDGVTGEIPGPLKGSVGALAVDEQTHRIFALDPREGRLLVVDGFSHQIVASTLLPGVPVGLAINPSTRRVYVAANNDAGKGLLGVVDEDAPYSALASVSLELPSLRAVAVDSKLNRVYITSALPLLGVVDGATNQRLQPISIGGRNAQGIAVDPEFTTVFVALRDDDAVRVARLNPANLSAPPTLSTVGVGDAPAAVAVDPLTHRVYVTDAGPNGNALGIGGRLSILHLADSGYVEAKRVAVGRDPEAVAIDGANRRIFVANAGGPGRLATFENGFVSVVSVFDPIVHGFHFANLFTGQLTIGLPLLGSIDLLSVPFGLCGGMVFSALDSYNAGGGAPPTTTAPPQGSQLRGHLYSRLLNTLLPNNAETIRRLLKWMTLPTHNKPGITGLTKRTEREFEDKIHPQLLRGQAVPLVLVRTKFNVALDLLAILDGSSLLRGTVAFSEFLKVFKNHQVLAIGDFKDDSGHWIIQVYDPNHPNTATYLEIGRGVETYHPGGATESHFRGFFAIDYHYEHPYWVPPAG